MPHMSFLILKDVNTFKLKITNKNDYTTISLVGFHNSRFKYYIR